MLTFSQQYDVVSKVFHSFANGKKMSAIRLSDKELERGKLFLTPGKYESFTKGNFIVLVLYTMFYRKPSSKIELLKTLNSFSKEEYTESLKIRDDALSFNYVLKRDRHTLDSLTVTPYEAYKLKKINAFSVADYYNQHPTEIKGRIMKKEIADTQVLLSHFNVQPTRQEGN